VLGNDCVWEAVEIPGDRIKQTINAQAANSRFMGSLHEITGTWRN